ncbi:hypothetical protein AVDCRST_MAG81-4230 [uncultured Synechococcales cyanobacterium]|uniref:Uncharacterized protein n=1 Tax=uncultured Synechococcales cyanobacterium TaxID=1936017 RepID=A0A6J4VSR3_9CYAN|nr:hypothetical protein AVDCRST_MAG81-4230 [uncultured Synechococcales cyanobacterium]
MAFNTQALPTRELLLQVVQNHCRYPLKSVNALPDSGKPIEFS